MIFTIQVNINGTARMGTVIGFSPFNTYSCTIHAVTVADGPISDHFIVTTAEAGIIDVYDYTFVVILYQ